MENYHEYRGRSQKRPVLKAKKSGYLKKFLRQSIVSLLILGIIFSPNILGSDNSSKIRDIIKCALKYQIDFNQLSDIFGTALEKAIPSYNQGVLNEEQKNVDKKVFWHSYR